MKIEGLDLKQLKKYAAKLASYRYWLFSSVLIAGLAATFLMLNQTLSAPSDEVYREEKLAEGVRSGFNDKTIEEIEKLSKSNDTTTNPPKLPTGVRINPFAE